MKWRWSETHGISRRIVQFDDGIEVLIYRAAIANLHKTEYPVLPGGFTSDLNIFISTAVWLFESVGDFEAFSSRSIATRLHITSALFLRVFPIFFRSSASIWDGVERRRSPLYYCFSQLKLFVSVTVRCNWILCKRIRRFCACLLDSLCFSYTSLTLSLPISLGCTINIYNSLSLRSTFIGLVPCSGNHQLCSKWISIFV